MTSEVKFVMVLHAENKNYEKLLPFVKWETCL